MEYQHEDSYYVSATIDRRSFCDCQHQSSQAAEACGYARHAVGAAGFVHGFQVVRVRIDQATADVWTIEFCDGVDCALSHPNAADEL